MLGLRVYLYDKVVPTETPEDIQELVALLSGFLRLYSKHPGRIQDYQQGKLSFDIVPSVSLRKMSEWLQLAWESLSDPLGDPVGATGDEIYNALLRLGFQSTAKDPKTAVKASIRLGGQFSKVGTGKNKEAVWALKDSITDDSPAMTVKPPRFTLDDPRRQTSKVKVVDYAIRALIEMGGKSSKEDLARLMSEYGWKTKSDDKPGLVAATLRKYQEFEKRGESWVFSPLYKKQDEDAE